MIQKLASLFDLAFTGKNLERLEKIVLIGSITGFIIHLLLVFIRNNFETHWEPLNDMSTNYLSSIYTPFSIILFYEVVLIIEALPKEFPLSIAKQYEIISLILIRRVFKDVSEFESIESWDLYPHQLFTTGLDMVGGLILFLLVALFYQVNRKTEKIAETTRNEKLINYEKSIGFLLLIVFLVLSVTSFWQWISHLLGGPPFNLDGEVGDIFYRDFFGIMVFFDVLLLLISFIFFRGYPEIFRNAGFVLSIILIRISFFSPRIYNVAILVIAIGFGLLTIVIYNYHKAKDHHET